MFEHLDDVGGVPIDADRRARTKRLATQIRTRRRVTAGVTAVALALPLGAVVVATPNDRDPVQVSTDAGLPEPPVITVPEITTTLPSLPTTTVTSLPPTTTPPTTAAKPPASLPPTGPPVFDPALYDRTAVLEEMSEPGATGRAGAKQIDAANWTITVVVERLVPGVRYSVLVHRPEPDDGTPFPTVCKFVASPDGWGACSGAMEARGGPPDTVGVMSGADGGAAVTGRFY